MKSEQLEILPSTKSASAGKFTTESTRSSAECRDQSDKITTIKLIK